MGNQSTNSSEQPNFEHPKLKDATVSQSKKIVLDYKMPANYSEWSKRHSAISKINDTYSIFLPTIEEIQRENFCGTQKSLKLIYNMFPYTLDQEIQKRQKLTQKFTEQQLWYLLYQLLLGCSVFQKKRQKSGDVRPRNILINEQGHINIVSSVSFPDEMTNYYKSLLYGESTFLAPEELAQLEAKMKYCKSDPSIAESFSVGLTVMDAALLFDSEQLYDMKGITFKNYLYNDNLVSFKSMKLSPFFIKTVLNLLEVKSFDRPTPGETLAILAPYQAQIIELQQFIPDRERSKTSLQQFQHCSK